MLNRRLSKAILFKVAYTLLTVLCLPSLAHATTCCFDCNGGNDGNAATTPSAAWKTSPSVNAKQFAPGDSLLFITECTWTGTLHPGSSGTNGITITINQADTGSMPHIGGGGTTEAVLRGKRIANRQFIATANSSGEVGITFTSGANNALISGIEID